MSGESAERRGTPHAGAAAATAIERLWDPHSRVGTNGKGRVSSGPIAHAEALARHGECHHRSGEAAPRSAVRSRMLLGPTPHPNQVEHISNADRLRFVHCHVEVLLNVPAYLCDALVAAKVRDR